MRQFSKWKRNAIILLAALGVGALYGGATGFIFWLLNYENAAEIGGFVSTATGGLALLAALLFIAYVLAPRNELKQPLSQLERGFVWLAGISLCLLVAIPFAVLTLGRLLRRLVRKPTKEEK